MAKYKREFLVPYLRDVYYIEALCKKLTDEYNHAEREIRQRDWNMANWKAPSEPHEAVGDSDNLVAFILYGIFFMISLIVIAGGSGNGLFSILLSVLRIPAIISAVICGGFALFFMCCAISDEAKVSEANKSGRKYYQKSLERYRNETPIKMKQWNEEKEYWIGEKNRIQNLYNKADKERRKIYDVNIIARQYRGLAAAWYLYDYFSSCRENDLDKILQTMLLDEISRKLDRIISQLQEVIVNQRTQIALQEQNNRIEQQNHERQMKRLAAMEQNQELQLDYQRMIACNTSISTFILTDAYDRYLHKGW